MSDHGGEIRNAANGRRVVLEQKNGSTDTGKKLT